MGLRSLGVPTERKTWLERISMGNMCILTLVHVLAGHEGDAVRIDRDAGSIVAGSVAEVQFSAGALPIAAVP